MYVPQRRAAVVVENEKAPRECGAENPPKQPSIFFVFLFYWTVRLYREAEFCLASQNERLALRTNPFAHNTLRNEGWLRATHGRQRVRTSVDDPGDRVLTSETPDGPYLKTREQALLTELLLGAYAPSVSRWCSGGFRSRRGLAPAVFYRDKSRTSGWPCGFDFPPQCNHLHSTEEIKNSDPSFMAQLSVSTALTLV